MSDLLSQECKAHEKGSSPLTQNEAENHLKDLDSNWSLSDNNSISREFKFKNYYETIAFVNLAATVAHQQDHHPDLLISYNRCTVTYSTHIVGGLSINDFICAAKINAAQNL